MPPAPPVSKEATGGGVFAMGALLLVAVVLAVVLFWGGLLKKREAPRPPKHDEKKQGELSGLSVAIGSPLNNYRHVPKPDRVVLSWAVAGTGLNAPPDKLPADSGVRG
jgi:hypothetical protein